MNDCWGRTIDYLRISVTDRCNLRCVYCMPENGVVSLAHKDILTYEEIVRIVKVCAGLGIKKVKLTGGEPLVRKDLARLVSWLKAQEGIESVTLTTNGILLKNQLKELVSAGLDGVNISLDTLDPNAYKRITRQGDLETALAGLNAALSYAESLTVKVNCVPLNNDPGNLSAMAGLAKSLPVHVRFIEMMPMGLGQNFAFTGEDEILEILEKAYGKAIAFNEPLGNGPCHYYSFPGFCGKVGFISAMSHKFCSRCNRVRLSADGFLKTCLQYDSGCDLKALIRSGCDDPGLARAIIRAIDHKPKDHHFGQAPSDMKPAKADKDETLSMFQIGG